MTVDKLVQMVKMKMPEATILQSVRANKKSLKPSLDDLMKLKEAGASDAIINELSGAESSAPAASSSPAAATPTPIVAAYNTDLSTVACQAATEVRKRVVAIEEFDYSAVKTSTQAVFGTQVDIGKGMRALLIKSLSDAGKYKQVQPAKIK